MGQTGEGRKARHGAAVAVAAAGAGAGRARRAGPARGDGDRRIRAVLGPAAAAAAAAAPARAAGGELPRAFWERVVDAAAAETKGLVRFVRDRVMPRLEAAVRASMAPRVRFSALPLASSATALAPDASHPHVTAKFAPSLPKKERDKLREAIAIKLKGLYVYTLANASNEFVTVSSDHAPEKQISLLCFDREDAESMLRKVRSSKGEADGDVQVIRVRLDKMYAFACEAAASLGPLSAFRFLPDRREVYNAIKLHQAAGHETDRLIGVPVFQAEGLTINRQEGKTMTKSVPLFLTRKDLDIAVDEAFKENADKAKLEVGTLEDVLTRMESPGYRSWGDIIFIGPGKSEEMFRPTTAPGEAPAQG